MSITGGIKFFSRPSSLFSNGDVTVIASSGDASSPRALDRNRVTYWRSVGSNDTITETYTITFGAAKTITRILMTDHNFKSYNIKYYSGATYVHFANVVGIDGAMANITETVFADDSSYYEFDSVSTTSIQVSVTTAQVANAEKYLNLLYTCTELGTLQGYPDISNVDFSRNEKSKKMLSGRYLALKSEETFGCALAFKNYPASLSADIDLIFSLFDLEETFLVWLCGGRRGSTYFRKQLRGWRLRDVFSMQSHGGITPDYRDNVYVNPVNLKVAFEESVD